MQKSMGMKYEPSSEPLHISAKRRHAAALDILLGPSVPAGSSVQRLGFRAWGVWFLDHRLPREEQFHPQIQTRNPRPGAGWRGHAAAFHIRLSHGYGFA